VSKTIGDRVSWTSGAAGKIGDKTGVIERVWQPGEVPARSEIREPGLGRDGVSYLIKADNGKLYWPRVKGLKFEAAMTPKLRVWWIPQVPCQRFFVAVVDVAQARHVIDTLARYDLFQFEHHIKPDYANAGGLEMFDLESFEWVEWADDDGNDIANKG